MCIRDRVVAYSADITNSQKVNEMIDEAIKQFGRMDILVNNAGIMDDKMCIRDSNTTAPLGSGIIKTYLEHIDKMDNVEILYETKGESLIQEDGRVVGVIAKNPDGSKLTVKANKGVIIATGG